MKKQNAKEHVAERVFKQFFLYLYSDIFGDYLLEKIRKHKTIKNEASLTTFLNRCRAEILILMQRRNISSHWFQTFYNVITKSELDLPLHEGISISVGNYHINSVNFDESKVRESGASAVRINITSNASPTQIKLFFKNNAKLVGKLQELLNLPKVVYPRLDNFGEGVSIHLMKDYEKLSHKKIGEVLAKQNRNIGRDTIKGTAKRYRRYLKKV